jgi:hypothetical protein
MKRNRAKCRLCNEIIESLHQHDFQSCSCGEISVDGGTSYYRCLAKDIKNFIRIGENDEEIEVRFKEEEEEEEKQPPKPLTSREEKLDEMRIMLEQLSEMPEGAMSLFVSQYELYSYMLLVYSILKDPPCTKS